MPQVSQLSSQYTAGVQRALEIHGNQIRKGTSTPYLAHVLSVSALVLESGGDEDCAIAGLLHDAVEDSPDGAWMLDRIRGQFGERVAAIVSACSDTVAVPGEVKPPWRKRKETYVRHLQSTDADALLVSACDKLHNARAIASDMRDVGNALWERFGTKSGTDQIWYYQSLCDAFASRVNSPLAAELQDAVELITRRGIQLGITTDEQRAWLTHNPPPETGP